MRSDEMKTGSAKLPFLVFDVDDTLYLERDYVKSGFNAVGLWLEAKHDVTGFGVKAWALFNEGHRGNIFNLALTSLGAEAEPSLIDALVNVYREHRPDIQLAPDAKRCLEQWNPDHCAAITDGYAIAQKCKVDALGLEQYCSAVVRTGVWGKDYWKPHPRSFQWIQEHAGQPHSALTYIGDNPAKDFVGARKLGWKTVRIRRPGGLHAETEADPGYDGDRTITSLDELLSPGIQEWLRAA